MAGLVRVCPVNMNTEHLDKTAFVQECLDWASRLDYNCPSVFLQASYQRCHYQAQIYSAYGISPNEDGFDCICPKLPMALLGVCRTIYRETFEMLYRENRFRICQTQRRGLTPLRQVSPRAVALLRTLSIRLNRCCCFGDGPCELESLHPDVYSFCRSCHGGCRGGDDAPLYLPCEAVALSHQHDLLTTWREVVGYLAQNIQPGKLRLSVICDCTDEATAELITQPLLALPTLAACDIRLGRYPRTVQADISQSIALALIGQPPQQKPFPFLRLPAELRMRVLQYTQLVHPNGTVKWWHVTSSTSGSCCDTCTCTLDACCCYTQHGAFSTLDTRCSCWTTPTSLFLVSRQFYNDGMHIFFSYNTFQINWDTDGYGQVDGATQSLDMLLTRFPESIYPYIRKIHIRVRGLRYDTLGPGADTYESRYNFALEWRRSIALMATKLNLSRLTLWIEELAQPERTALDPEMGIDDGLRVEEKEWKLSQHLVQPLVDLGEPLGDFALSFFHPPYHRYGELRRQRRQQLEQRVMGK